MWSGVRRRFAVVLNWPSTPHWCPLTDGCKSCRCCRRWRVALAAAKWKKEKTCHELTGKMCRARLVVLAAKVGSRWSAKTARFRRLLQSQRGDNARTPPAAAWFRRSTAMLACGENCPQIFGMKKKQNTRCEGVALESGCWIRFWVFGC